MISAQPCAYSDMGPRRPFRVIDAAAVEAPSSGTRIALLTGPELAAPMPEPDYLVREIGLVAGGGAPHLVAGYGFTGKTLAAQSLALSLAAGVRVWGVYGARQPRRVAHVDLEQGERLTRRRYQRLALAMGVDLRALGDALAVAVMPPISLRAEHEESWRELMTGRDLVIVDSLRAATGGADENDSGIRAGLDMLAKVSDETGCRPLVIHHARKPNADDPGGRYAIRGSSAIYDACDSVYVFSAAQGEPVLIEHVKARSHGEPTEPVALVIADVEHAGDPRAGVRVVVHGAELVSQRRAEREAEAQRVKARHDAEVLRSAILATPGQGAHALRERTGLSGARYRAALAFLGDEVEIREEKRGRATVYAHYLRGAS